MADECKVREWRVGFEGVVEPFRVSWLGREEPHFSFVEVLCGCLCCAWFVPRNVFSGGGVQICWYCRKELGTNDHDAPDMRSSWRFLMKETVTHGFSK